MKMISTILLKSKKKICKIFKGKFLIRINIVIMKNLFKTERTLNNDWMMLRINLKLLKNKNQICKKELDYTIQKI